jgi:dynein heavy chain, axonemal
MRLSIWNSLDEWGKLKLQWVDTPFEQIDAEAIKSKCDFYSKIINKCIKNMPPNSVLDKLKKLVFEFKDTIPVVVALRNPALTVHHWQQIK